MIRPSNNVKIVGVTIDSSLSFDAHITHVCCAANHHIRALRHIRPMLDLKTANTIACSTVLSRLDYCNSVLAGISNHNLTRLQRVQNSLARATCIKPWHHSAAQLLQDLHWLPVRQRIDYKIALLTHKTLKTCQPSYLHDHLHSYAPARHLRSASGFTLTVPPNKLSLASSAFEYYAPRLWNSLPAELRNSVNHLSVDAFKSRLKTHLFTSAFQHVARP